MVRRLRDRAKLVIVSNRLPFSITTDGGELHFEQSTGGLASGLQSYLEGIQTQDEQSHVWLGWPGSTVPEALRNRVAEEAASGFSAVPVFLSQEEMESFYHGFCNKTIWPLFHYFPSFTSFSPATWEQYRNVNERFAEAVDAILSPHDQVWIHDYHLMLLPALLRKRRRGISIGFFLHIPFPAYEVYRLLPGTWRREILEGLLGADLIGFHTYDYTQHFLQCVLRILEQDHNLGLITLPSHAVRVETFPMGIDFERYHQDTASPEVEQERHALRQSLGSARVILSIDRLDYTKGIVHRLEAFSLLLEKHPEHQRKVVLVMVVVPSRVAVAQYEEMKKQIEETVGRINGKFGTIDWTPILYMYRNLAFAPLLSLYRESEIALITPLRDGMNLIAKEYVAARTDGRGVLILSEMAGAAKELGEAIIINPNNREDIAEGMHEALQMSVAEQQRRNRIMQARLKRYDVHRWACDFLTKLHDMKQVQDQYLAKLLSDETRLKLVESFASTPARLLLLDYDGTLVPFKRNPQAAVPSPDLMDLLRRLVSAPGTRVVIVSGRDKETLERWFGDLPLALVAEHGAAIRERDGTWSAQGGGTGDWKAQLLPMLELYADRLPGAMVEVKESGLVFHFRGADPDQSRPLTGDLIDHLSAFTANVNVQVIRGNRVVEIRPSGINKGAAVQQWISGHNDDFILAMGDDYTDEDLFLALPQGAYSIKIGMASTRARFNLRDTREAVSLLDTLARKISPDQT